MAARSSLDVGALYEQHGETLLVFFARRTFDPDLALDLWAETFAQALAGRRRFKGVGRDAEAAWLYTIAHRQLAHYYRKGKAQRRAQQRLQMERPQATEEAEAALLRRAGLAELRVDLGAALATLSEETRRAIELRVVQELSFSEVAAALGTTEQAARARVSRGLRALGDLLDQDTITEAVRP